MTYYPDLGTRTCVAEGERIRAIGWLNPDHSYNRGDVPSEFVDRLKTFVEHQHLSITFPWILFLVFMSVNSARESNPHEGNPHRIFSPVRLSRGSEAHLAV